MFGQETVNYLLAPEVLDRLNNLRGIAQRMSFQELNTLYEFYSQHGKALAEAPSAIRNLFAAAKSDNATALLAWVGFIYMILQVTGIIGAPDLSAEDIADIIREYELQHPDEIPSLDGSSDNEISLELIAPPKVIDS